ncbi:MAG: AbrB/MazE/SpoVT family DNA-binding domain-containing protein [Candidatus Aegiribacteria sp.]|nr:AbrB/MazE/SpoVT family DNA-binding domain-containing protein [Candidatus Aegiribacteria sp.]
MLTRIQKWGNSQGLRIAKHLLTDAQINIGDEVNVELKDGNIIISPVHKKRDQYNLKDLVAQIPADYKVSEVDWDGPVGKEDW